MTPPCQTVALTCALVQEVGQEAAHDGLVADDQDVLLPLQLHDDWLQPLHQVFIRLFGVMGRNREYLSWTSQSTPGVAKLRTRAKPQLEDP